MQKAPYDVVLFFIVVSAIILCMIGFIVFITYAYKKRQMQSRQIVEALKLDYEKNLLAAQLEMQEQTFEHIAREIHDNISLSLTLAKLHLHTVDWKDTERSQGQVVVSIGLLTQSIAELSNLSRGLNADVITANGLLKAVEEEVERIRQAGLFAVEYSLIGEPVYLDGQRELIIFRIIQEAFNNIIKHASANHASLGLLYNGANLHITVTDNGVGFDLQVPGAAARAGLKNMQTRAKLLGGTMHIDSRPGGGATLQFTIPFNEHEN